MNLEVEEKILQQFNQIARQLKDIQLSLDKLASQHRQQEAGLVQGLRKTRLKARQRRSG